jgi:hypothetical protein
MAQRSELSSVILPSGHRRYMRAEIEALADSHASSDSSPLGSDETAGTVMLPVDPQPAGADSPFAPACEPSEFGDAA